MKTIEDELFKWQDTFDIFLDCPLETSEYYCIYIQILAELVYNGGER